MVVLGGGLFLMSEVPLYRRSQRRSTKNMWSGPKRRLSQKEKQNSSFIKHCSTGIPRS